MGMLSERILHGVYVNFFFVPIAAFNPPTDA
jgi:hypothetical protein